MLNGLIVILLIASILFLRRGNTESTRLNLRRTSDSTPQTTMKARSVDDIDNMDGADSARSLNVVFQHEGNWYDAFEVLELPAGTSLEDARTRFNELLKSVEPARIHIIKEAIKAIASHVSK